MEFVWVFMDQLLELAVNFRGFRNGMLFVGGVGGICSVGGVGEVLTWVACYCYCYCYY